MKRIFILGLSVSVLIGGIFSCKKTSKGKMVNEWSVIEFTSVATVKNDFGVNSKVVKVLDGASLKTTSTGIPSPMGDSSMDLVTLGTVNSWTYSIKKDGTWSSTENITITRKDSTFESSVWNVVITKENELKETSGIWNFIGKSKAEDFKKNERVLFNILISDTKISVKSGNDNSQIFVDKSVYNVGDEVLVYTVVESKRKELILESDSKQSTVNSDGNTFNSTYTSTFTLTQK